MVAARPARTAGACSHAVSTFGNPLVVVGLATNPTLDETSPDYRWTSHQEVFRSDLRRKYRPSADGSNVFIETDPVTSAQSGWLTVGGNFGGIYQVPLDLTTGLPNRNAATWHKVAKRPAPFENGKQKPRPLEASKERGRRRSSSAQERVRGRGLGRAPSGARRGDDLAAR